MLTGYVGTYASPESRGIYQFTLDPDTGAMTVPSLCQEAPDAKCLALRGGLLAAPVSRAGRAGVCLLDVSGTAPRLLDQMFRETRTSCYMAFHGDRLFTANYHEGAVLHYRAAGGTLELPRRLEIAPHAGCHQVLFHGGLLLVPCLELDRVLFFRLDHDLAPAGELVFPPGTGPRHGVFTRDHGRLYLVGERNHLLFSYRVRGEAFTPDPPLSILPPAAPADSATAAVRLSPDERFLYVSTRGADLLSVFSLEGKPRLIQQLPCGGRHPRDFALTPDGRFLVSVNRASKDLVCFPLGRADGRLGEPLGRVPLSEGVALVFK